MSKKIKKSEAEILEEEAGKGNISALYNLGYIYLLGDGVEKNEAKAVQYFRRGTTHQDTKCMQALAMCYKNGDGVEKDIKKMIYWLNNGAKLEDAGCQYHLALCYETGQGVNADIDMAVSLMKKSAVHNKDARIWLTNHGYKAPNFFSRLFGGRQ